jgi:hypothetical protein
LVEFLTRREALAEDAYLRSDPPMQLQFYELPTMLAKRYPWSEKVGEMQGGSTVSRPSAVAGSKYDAVSRAYVQAVRSVLMRQSTAPEAAATLEKELVRITGFEVLHKSSSKGLM